MRDDMEEMRKANMKLLEDQSSAFQKQLDNDRAEFKVKLEQQEARFYQALQRQREDMNEDMDKKLLWIDRSNTQRHNVTQTKLDVTNNKIDYMMKQLLGLDLTHTGVTQGNNTEGVPHEPKQATQSQDDRVLVRGQTTEHRKLKPPNIEQQTQEMEVSLETGTAQQNVVTPGSLNIKNQDLHNEAIITPTTPRNIHTNNLLQDLSQEAERMHD